MEPLYERLCRRLLTSWSAAQLKELRRCWSSFNLDEYVGLGADDPCSFAAYMVRHLQGPLGLHPGSCVLPRGDAPVPAEEARRYRRLIAATGGLGLQLLGLGVNGHVAFNEPPCRRECSTRVVHLTASTRAANEDAFDDDRSVPGWAITLGLEEILAAREIWLVVSGEAKAAALARALRGSPDVNCPASWLQCHPRLTIWADTAAAAELGS